MDNVNVKQDKDQVLMEPNVDHVQLIVHLVHQLKPVLLVPVVFSV